ncbi:TetR/AcrR family transcriptional regulator [Corynebacterium timonense]|uniref:DNA-binding transcriptional regulator, AcrR family n=1 Tax=Corynebacterium timonense TaxID=441500 RepID=A0A1H1UBB1_9CORY|nr:TetR/AcrR family transcriptional regulator [Corynebacterium timonense]SDS69219.1 DNA-binding transcriptional regulator, AcrR family [Corynebacterium timonense]
MRADARHRRQLIINAATRTFRAAPDVSITLEGIAKEAGVGIATLYRHFPTRRDLRTACALDLLDTLDAVIAEALESFDTEPVRHWEGLICRMVDEGTGMLDAALAEQHTGDIDPSLLTRLEQVIARFDELLAKAARRGLVDASLDARVIAAELIAVTRPRHRAINELFPDVRERMVRHLLVAWRPQRA